jgi:hypothetical protein
VDVVRRHPQIDGRVRSGTCVGLSHEGLVERTAVRGARSCAYHSRGRTKRREGSDRLRGDRTHREREARSPWRR